jgi:glycosyltransferase involved in cell wall biosynthesis
MKILWVNTNFLHPTTKGGQIRTLEMLRWLSQWHEIHYVALEDPRSPEGPRRAGEYSARAYPFRYAAPSKPSPAFYAELARGLVSAVPVAVSRFCPPGMRLFLADLIRKERFDRAVVDHLAPTSYFPDLGHSLLFQHNVETMIWRRNAEHAATALRKLYFQLQAARMFEYERRVSLAAGHIVAVSEEDAAAMRSLFGVTLVTPISTGVNLEYFAPPQTGAPGQADPAPLAEPTTQVKPAPPAELVFVGSMDWLANIDAVTWFVREVLPLIRRQHPAIRLAVVGRTPSQEILDLASADPGILVTGTVPDVRPYLWGAKISIVPLRIGGGTRLKIYESMAAGTAVVSTVIGAEGLEVRHPSNIRLAATADEFARECVDLLDHPEERLRLAAAGREMVTARCSWKAVAREFEPILDRAPALPR